MKKYLAQLRPVERRLVVGVAVVVLVALNWAFIWPHFHDFGDYQSRRNSADLKLRNFRNTIAQKPSLLAEIKKYKSQGESVALEDQAVNFIRKIQDQSTASGVRLDNTSRPNTKTNDLFFIEQWQNIHVIATEDQLVDFLYKLGSDSSMIRVADLTLQPDPPRYHLAADIKLVASYQKKPAPPAAVKNTTAKK